MEYNFSLSDRKAKREESYTSDWVLALERMGYCLKIALLSSSLCSPSGIGVPNDSIASPRATVFQDSYKYHDGII